MTERKIQKRKKRGRNITDRERAEILVRKDLARQTGKTYDEIASEMKCSKWVVQNTKESTVTQDVLDLYQKKKERLAEKALDVTLAALEKGEELIYQADTSKALSGIAAMGKFADTVHRLERGEPTQIAANVSTETHALEFIRMLMGRMSEELAMEAFRRASLEPLVPENRKLEIISRIESGDLKLLPA